MERADNQPFTPPDGNDVPCRGIATYMLNLAKLLLLENCEQHGSLTAGEIEAVFDRLLEAPGDLPKIFASKFSKCSAAILQLVEVQNELSDSFQNQLTNIIGDTTKTVSIGHLQTVGLNNIKSGLGDRWEALADRVVEIAEHCITKRLTAHDTYFRSQNNGFIICFAELSGEEAMFKARAIEGDITQMLLGQNENDKLEQFDLNAEQWDELANLSVRSLEIEVSPAEAAGEALCDKLLAKLNSAANQLREDTESMLNSLAQNVKIRPRPALKLSGESTRSSLLGWDAMSKAKSMQLQALSGNDAKILAKLDRISLLSAATFLSEQRDFSVPILWIGVDLGTLSTKQLLSGYLDVCNELSNDFREKIAFNVHIPRSQVYHGGTLDKCNFLRSFCVAQSIQIQEPILAGLAWETAGLSMIVMDHKDFLLCTRTHAASLKSLSNKLRNQRVKLLVDEVPHSAKKDLLREYSVELFALQGVFS